LFVCIGGTGGLVVACVFGFGRISNWALVDFCYARSRDGSLSLQTVACPEKKDARDRDKKIFI